MSEQPEVRNLRDLNAHVKAIVEREMIPDPSWVGGVVKGSYESDRRHIYFTLEDGEYSIYCMLPERIRGTLDFTLNNQMEVEVYGTVRVYDRKARLELQVEKARLIHRPVFVIDANLQEQLTKRGLFPKTKKILPKEIKQIALITSSQSDALHDFEHTYRDKATNPAKIKVIDVRLEGQQAPREIADAINRVNNNMEADVIVLIRGGGRRADLATFNDFLIAEAICRSNIPVVTGIGHQRDETFADQVADVSRITPTAAAQELANASSLQTPPPAPPPNEPPAAKSSFQNMALLIIGFMIALAALIFAIGQLN
jgi:exodeoxyribonuclease VII large subunit